jgi:solute carrier family 25 carnitine/acylcarnitine transporter 20/29
MTDPQVNIHVPPAILHSPLRQSLQDIAAGTVGGLCTVLVGHPLDTIKVRLQTAAPGSGLNMLSCMRLTLREEGIRGFYKGMQSPLAGEGFFNAVQFLVYGASKRWLLSRNEGFGVPQLPTVAAPGGARAPLTLSNTRTDLSIIEYFMAGGLTGFACSFVETPIDLFKSQLQTQIFHPQPAFTTFPQSLAYVWRIGGIRGCFQGMGATFLRTIPASACYFGVYEWVKSLLVKPGKGKESLGETDLLLAGGCGGTAYWLSSFPADNVKSSIQADEPRKSQRKFRNVWDCARQLYAEGGVRRFYRGLTPCLIRSFPANAACFYAYEKSLQFMDRIK